MTTIKPVIRPEVKLLKAMMQAATKDGTATVIDPEFLYEETPRNFTLTMYDGKAGKVIPVKALIVNYSLNTIQVLPDLE